MGMSMLQGMLARKREPGQTKTQLAADAEAKKSGGVTVLYGSQTGTAAEIAKNIGAEAQAKGMTAAVRTMNGFDFSNVSAENTPIVIMVVSSTGDGEAPDNCGKFFQAVKK